jgi:menaquinone-dependent protoporphyrinogen oxidase
MILIGHPVHKTRLRKERAIPSAPKAADFLAHKSMKTLILYGSKYGFTADCAGYLKNNLSGDITLFNIYKVTCPIQLEQFDTIIIGSSVYIGKISKKLRQFCNDNLEQLTKKKVGIFLCCALTQQADEVLTTNFPSQLLEKACVVDTFGSEARLDKMSFLDKTIIKAVTKGDFSNFKASKDSMDAFIKKLR